MERKLIKPFGPTILKVTMPEELIKQLNDYVEKTIQDEKKAKDLDVGHSLVGNVKQEFKLEIDFMQKSGWGKFLMTECSNWILGSTNNKKITKFQIINSWIVRQFENEYNPIHTHGGHVSGVGYLKVPSNLGETKQKNKEINRNGHIQFIHGSKMFLSSAILSVEPKVGDFYFFPNYLMHTVYPYEKCKDERRSVSFNAVVDEEIYNSLS